MSKNINHCKWFKFTTNAYYWQPPPPKYSAVPVLRSQFYSKYAQLKVHRSTVWVRYGVFSDCEFEVWPVSCLGHYFIQYHVMFEHVITINVIRVWHILCVQLGIFIEYTKVNVDMHESQCRHAQYTNVNVDMHNMAGYQLHENGNTYMTLIQITSFLVSLAEHTICLCRNTSPFQNLSHNVNASFLDETDNGLKTHVSLCGETRVELGPGWQPTYPPILSNRWQRERALEPPDPTLFSQLL